MHFKVLLWQLVEKSYKLKVNSDALVLLSYTTEYYVEKSYCIIVNFGLELFQTFLLRTL